MPVVPIPMRPLERTGRVAAPSKEAIEVFGWPCRLTVELDSGETAYLLDPESCSQAPRELLRLSEAGTSDGWVPETAVRVSVIPVFQRFIVIRIKPRDFDPEASSARSRRRQGSRESCYASGDTRALASGQLSLWEAKGC